MTVSERKLQILLNINQHTVSSLVDEMAKLSVENEELKEKIAKLEKEEPFVPPADV